MPIYVFKNSKKAVAPWVVTLENDRDAELMAAAWADQGWSRDEKADVSALIAAQSSQAPAEPAKSTTTKEN